MNKDNVKIHSSGLLLLLIISATIFYQGGAVFDRSDDAGIVSILRGSNGLQASPYAIYISNILGYILFWLYSVAKFIPWYSITIYFCLYLSFILSIAVIYKSFNNKYAVLFFLLSISLFFYTIARSISFTAVSLMLTCTSSLSIIFHVLNDERMKLSSSLVYGILAAFAYLLRPSLLAVSLIALIPVAAYCFQYGTKKIALTFFAPLLIAIFLNLSTDFLHNEQPEVKNYVEYNKGRSLFHDTRIAGWDWSVSGGVEPGSGWDFADYAVARNWWIFDKNVFNVKTYEKIVGYSPKTDIFSLDEFSQSWEGAKYYVLIAICIVLFSTCYCANHRISFVKLRIINYSCVVFVVISIFMLMFVRFPQRVAFPLLFFMAFLSAITSEKIKVEFFRLRYAIIFSSLTIASVCCYYIYGEIDTDIKYRFAERSYFNDRIQIINGFFDKNTIFVIKSPNRFPDTSSPFSEDSGYGNLKLFPSGWLTGSPLYYRFLEENNFRDTQRVVPGMIGNPRVVLLFWDTPGYWNVYKPVFLSHLRRHYTQKEPSKTPIAIREVLDLRMNGYGLLAMQLIGND